MIAELSKTKWYTIKVQNNREKSVSERIKTDMMRYYNMELNFLIPTKAVASVKNGKKVVKEQILYPGYVFVQTDSIDKVEHLVKGTNGATNVLKDARGLAQPLKQSEIDKMIVEKEKTKEVVESTLIKGEKVEVITGPFQNFKGTIDRIEENGKVRVEVLIFGRPTTVDLTLKEIIKIVD
jgi:transcriptional antiterminator NusG